MSKKRINKVLLILGIAFLLIGIFILVSSIFLISNMKFISNKNIIYNLEKGNIENNKISIFQKDQYKAMLSIPKISLIGKIYDIDSDENNVNKNIEVIKPSDFPDVLHGNLILASHSGNSNVSYFKNLDKLSIDDIAYVYYENKKYIYKIVDIYNQVKTGKIDIVRNKNETNLTLITCDKKDKKFQIVFIGKLINIKD